MCSRLQISGNCAISLTVGVSAPYWDSQNIPGERIQLLTQQERLLRDRQAEEEAELKQCTFRPVINPQSPPSDITDCSDAQVSSD